MQLLLAALNTVILLCARSRMFLASSVLIFCVNSLGICRLHHILACLAGVPAQPRFSFCHTSCSPAASQVALLRIELLVSAGAIGTRTVLAGCELPRIALKVVCQRLGSACLQQLVAWHAAAARHAVACMFVCTARVCVCLLSSGVFAT
jgi:hypothetical protein